MHLPLITTLLLATIATQPGATLIDNDQVKVVRALENPHIKSKFHGHPLNRVMIYLQPGQQRFEYQDGHEPTISTFIPGQVEWAPAIAMHSAEVLTDSPFNIIEIMLKSPATNQPVSASLDPARIDPKHYAIEFENSQVRVLRAKIEPHGIAPMHEHALNRVTVFLTAQDFRVTDAQGKVTFVKHKAGEAIWGLPITHQEENLSDQPFEVLAVELKH